MRPPVFTPVSFDDHALLDSGEGEKLERFGEVVLRRPDPQALWNRRLPATEWGRAHLTFVRESDRGGRWEAGPELPRSARGPEPSWTVAFGDATFRVQPTPFKHVGVFPEQATNWAWMLERASELERGAKLLNLFGYTGAASVLAAKAGMDVTHVDASRTATTAARDNAELSGLGQRGLRVVVEDALTFARREVRRERKYAGILVDPPHYGRGPKGEKWQFEDGISLLLDAAATLLDERGFLVLSTYAIGFSSLALWNLADGRRELEGGHLEAGELALPEEPRGDEEPRALPCGFCLRWRRGA